MYEYCMNTLRGCDATTDLVIGGCTCLYESVTVFDLSKYPKLKTLWIGSNGFKYVNELVISKLNELKSVTIDDKAFVNVNELKLTGLNELKNVTIGDESFTNVSVFSITGLNELEHVVIGIKSFTQHMKGHANDPNRHFYLKNCPKLKSLKIGRYSFSDYKVCEIENVDALETIEMSYINFAYASLELKSILIHRE